MTLSSLKRFLPTPPPRQVVLLPDALFFVRAITVTEGATAADVTAQAELALETVAPFPLAQLYYGHHWTPGAATALVYAAYRKRFTADDVAGWGAAEVVLPSFVTVLKKAPPAGTALVLPGAGGLTGLYFADTSGVPSQVRVAFVADDATEAERAAARETLLGFFPEKRHVLDAQAAPVFDLASEQGEFSFRAGQIETQFEAGELAQLDVRDKAELAARRRAHARDVILWRTFVGCLVALALALLFEFALVGSSLWQKQRLALQTRQTPVVEGIMTSQSLATRIEELSTKRLLPFEMLAAINTVRPRTIQFMRTVTTGLYTLEVEAQTNSSGDIDVFRSALNKLPACQHAEVLDPRSRDGLSTFKLVITFNPDAFKSDETESAPATAPTNAEATTPVASPAITPAKPPVATTVVAPVPAAPTTPSPVPTAVPDAPATPAAATTVVAPAAPTAESTAPAAVPATVAPVSTAPAASAQ